MRRTVWCLVFVTAAWGVGVSRAAAPLCPATDSHVESSARALSYYSGELTGKSRACEISTDCTVRELSLKEALELGLKHGLDGQEGDKLQAQRKIDETLLNVETAYWNLYGAYWTLHSREQGLRCAYEAFKLSKAGYEAGRVKAADLHQARGQYELFRVQRLQAIDTVLDNERQLRALIGMPDEEGQRLVPSSAPRLTAYEPDWKEALHEAVNRPELIQARQQAEANKRMYALVKGLDGVLTFLSGSPPLLTFARAYENCGRYGPPPPYVLVSARVDGAKTVWTRSLARVSDEEVKVGRFLSLQYRRMNSSYEQIKAQRAQREAFGEQLRARNQEFLAGRGTLDILLEAQRFWADALANEHNAIAQYNNALAGFAFARGTIQRDREQLPEEEAPCPDSGPLKVPSCSPDAWKYLPPLEQIQNR